MAENQWRCTATKTSGKRCKAFTKKGEDKCGVHLCMAAGVPVGRGRQVAAR